MIDYKRAAVIGLRIPSDSGLLTVKQLAATKSSTKLKILKTMASKIKTEDTSELLDFLNEDTPKINADDKLAFDIVKDLYQDQIAAEKARMNLSDLNREERELLAIKAEQDNAALRNDPTALQKRLDEIAKAKEQSK